MKIAIIHDWLVTYAGAERVLEQLIALYPHADVFSVIDFVPEKQRAFLHGKTVTTTFIQHLPWSKTRYRNYLPFMPFAIEQLDLSSYDLIISSSHAVAKGVITGPDQLHIAYIHSPIRYAWDLQHQYLKETGLNRGLKGWIVKYLLHRIRKWDQLSANRVDIFLANSNFIKRRIQKVYRRDAQVVFPPVATEDFQLQTKKQDYYFTASRMVPYKKMDLIVQAFVAMPSKKLKVIGDGPEAKKIQKIAQGHPNIELLGYQDFATLKHHMQHAKAFVFAAEEDFGITPVEAQACGTPVIAYGKGGVLDTIIDGKTGVYFNHQTQSAIIEAVERFERSHFDPCQINQHAQGFSTQVFQQSIQQKIQLEWARFQEQKND